MKTFKIENGDLVFDEVMNIKMIEGLDEVAQCNYMTLSVNKGKWFLNILHGLDYEKITGKGKTESDIKSSITEAILQESRVREVVKLEVDPNEKDRTVEVYYEAITDEGLIRNREVI